MGQAPNPEDKHQMLCFGVAEKAMSTREVLSIWRCNQVYTLQTEVLEEKNEMGRLMGCQWK